MLRRTKIAIAFGGCVLVLILVAALSSRSLDDPAFRSIESHITARRATVFDNGGVSTRLLCVKAEGTTLPEVFGLVGFDLLKKGYTVHGGYDDQVTLRNMSDRTVYIQRSSDHRSVYVAIATPSTKLQEFVANLSHKILREPLPTITILTSRI